MESKGRNGVGTGCIGILGVLCTDGAICLGLDRMDGYIGRGNAYLFEVFPLVRAFGSKKKTAYVCRGEGGQ